MLRSDSGTVLLETVRIRVKNRVWCHLWHVPFGSVFTMQSIDALIYTPLDEEYRSLQARFRPVEDVNGTTFTGYKSVGPDRESVVVLVGFAWGNDAAYRVMTEALGSFSPKAAFCVGIAGAISSDAKLGDVFYSTHVLDLTQRMKQERDKSGASRIKYDPDSYPSDEAIVKILDRSRLSATGASTYNKWAEACQLVNTGLLAGTKTKTLGKPVGHFRKPEATNGKIASTNMVLADTHAIEDVKQCGRKMACVDTESAGFAKACLEQKLTCNISIRGISDSADETKKLVEVDYQNTFRRVAASNAALFLYMNLSEIISSISRQPVLENKSLSIPLTNPIAANENHIKNELHQRSLAFKAVGQDKKIPVPRLRLVADSTTTLQSQQQPEQEIEEILSSNDRILVKWPANYPDSALPWLFASLIADSPAKSSYTIPVCIKWPEFGPPKNSLDAHLELLGLSFCKNTPRYRIVFFMIDAQLGSRSKAQYLTEQFTSFNNAAMVIFPDRSEFGALENEVETHFAPAQYAVEGISFSSITYYMRDIFGMPLDESEVLAARLISTFNNYHLKIHPTYLASIQRDTVLAFIEANQRGELLELAVAGLLSVLVAGDKSKVVLRRGTRERFLSKLAVGIYSGKHNYDEDRLEDYVNGYAKQMGFDISAKQFLRPFFENGILAYEGGYATIAVPVVRSYMLAKGLSEQYDEARAYFDLSGPNFDFGTFDLYCEFSNNSDIYGLVIDAIDSSIAFFRKKIAQYDAPVLNGKYEGTLLKKSSSVVDAIEEISRRTKELVDKTDLVSEKQAKLDIRSKVARSRTASSIDISDPNMFHDEHTAMYRLISGAILLGSAAEKMEDGKKLELINRIIVLADLICVDVLTIFSGFDFDAAVEEVTEKVIADGVIPVETDDSKKELKSLVQLVVGEWEFNLAAQPMMVLLSILCESGRTNVLLSPISRASTSSKLQDFFRSSWMFDMDPTGLRHLPKEISKKLGKTSTLLRFVFGYTMLNRSYWYHHGRANKAAISDGVEEMLKPLSLVIDDKSA
jgi:nucleoside phosphorylase